MLCINKLSWAEQKNHIQLIKLQNSSLLGLKLYIMSSYLLPDPNHEAFLPKFVDWISADYLTWVSFSFDVY